MYTKRVQHIVLPKTEKHHWTFLNTLWIQMFWIISRTVVKGTRPSNRKQCILKQENCKSKITSKDSYLQNRYEKTKNKKTITKNSHLKLNAIEKICMFRYEYKCQKNVFSYIQTKISPITDMMFFSRLFVEYKAIRKRYNAVTTYR